MKEPLNIISNADQSYCDGLMVTLLSALDSASGRRPYKFHVLDGGIHADAKEKLKQLVMLTADKKSMKVALVFHKLDFSSLLHLPKWRGSHMTYTKMLIANLLPETSEAVYVDSDTLINRGLEGFCDFERKQDTLIAGVADHFSKLGNEVPKNLKLRAEEYQSPYINAGIMWMNLEGFRRYDLLGRSSEMIENYPDIRKGDQTLLNYVCRNRVHLLEADYNLCLSLGTGMRVVDEWKTTNLHYIGENKPWSCNPTTTQYYAQKLWQIRAVELGVYDVINPLFPNRPNDFNRYKKKRWLNIFNRKRSLSYGLDLKSCKSEIS